MLKTPIARGVALATLGATLAIPTMAQAAFIEDTKAGLELRNFYFNRDFREVASTENSKAEEWAQGFLLRVESGYTEGTVGFGVDALGLLGVKLDSGGGRTGSGLLPADGDGSADDYSMLGLAAKAKVSETVLKVGTLQLKNMAISSSDSRLLPQTFQGAQIVSKEIQGLTLDGGYLNRANHRNSSNNEALAYGGKGAAVGETAIDSSDVDDFIFAGASYKLTNDLTASYYYSNLEEVYKQHSTNLVHILPLGDKQSLKTDLRYARSSEDGSSNVDNRALGAMLTYSLSGHSFGLGYQKMSGDTGFAYVGEVTDPYLVNYVQINDFAIADMKSWQARYDFNFASVGIPGLTFMTRYVTGDNVERGAGQSEGKIWERDMDIGYTFQEGTLKNLNVKWRNATARGNIAANNDVDENRLIVSYTIPLM
ncbi:OprD family porin [Pseudomonas songnenensis]|uniref:OprD family porin n=1 Tax=Pseudomonas songnenensis TaxID=1176259 RepID=A0ABX9UYI5_9PSED|nr:OprD family porin [Pseudomonas songnenensis]MCQ4301352.1 OprD family porin [Pseudomonas songnenensis]RMH98421.1 OprD family porin [Pseudomonas songnenensis]